MTHRKALVTGAAGFLGPHLVRALLERGYSVLGIDNFFNGRREHVESLSASKTFAFAEIDVTDVATLAHAVAGFSPDVVFHLAALHYIPYCVAHPSETLKVNVLGTQNVLDAIERLPSTRMILASTGDVYATSNWPHAETGRLGSTNIYGVSKAACEQLLALAQAKHPSTRFICARLFNLVGPGETNPHVLPDIFRYLKRGAVLRLGNMTPRRDYIHVTDAAEALVRMADYNGPECIFNVGTGIGSSVSELVETIGRALGSDITVEVDPAKVRPVERQHLVADISLAARELSWRPVVTLERGLQALLSTELNEAFSAAAS